MNGPAAPAPRLLVRMACGLYEGLLLFGVLAGVGLLYGVLLRPTGEQNWGPGFSLLMLAAMASYFTWFWSKGETLAMATWHLRLQRRGSANIPPSKPRALLRFVLSLLWFLPGLAAVQVAGLAGDKAAALAVMVANVLGYALLTRLHPSRQYLHDVLAGTEMVTLRRAIKTRDD